MSLNWLWWLHTLTASAQRASVDTSAFRYFPNRPAALPCQHTKRKASPPEPRDTPFVILNSTYTVIVTLFSSILDMGSALSKNPVRTPKAKPSLLKEKKKIEEISNTIAPRRTIAPIKVTTSLEEVDQSLLELNLTSGANSPAQTCHWDKLPTELKLRIFSYLGIIMGDPVRHPAMTGSKYHHEVLNFRLVNKEFRTLYRDVWYKSNTFVVAPIWMEPSEDNRPIFSYPEPRNGELIRSLQVELTVDWGHDALEMLRCQATDWCRLFRPRPEVSAPQEDEHGTIDDRHSIFFGVNEDGYADYCGCGASCSLGVSTTQWQDHFQSLDKLKINLRITGFGECSEGCSRSSHELLRIFMNSVRRLMNASEVLVSAKNVEVHVHCDCERAEAFLQSLVQSKIKKRCS
ncbi:hypothetical protein P171DRAFT_481110 [Karstenula rhodostoma CBS 690.94]|uniref:F-box domain-containing protein n=1 Tax=Karstenula rhodostoma CBS 690.94 TaxID=1392251 RepID=A0A9P4UHC8_9PLEO|nr:hypothetical protein P171DRAFT_481110 [Karstenula rhodostoma CBS 690.94]